VAVCPRLNADGEITDGEGRELAGVVLERLVDGDRGDRRFCPGFHPRNFVDTLIEISTDTM